MLEENYEVRDAAAYAAFAVFPEIAIEGTWDIFEQATAEMSLFEDNFLNKDVDFDKQFEQTNVRIEKVRAELGVL